MVDIRRRGGSGYVRPLAVFFLASGFAAFGGPQGQKQRPLRYDTAAVVKLVPVRVLDAGGRPVRGLTKADFVLCDNGEPRTITEFEVHESSDRRGPAEMPLSAAAGLAPAESFRRIFFILDMQGSDLFGNRDAKKAVLAFVKEKLMPGDEASVMTFGAFTGLVLRQYLTADSAKIESAIRRSIEMSEGSGRPQQGNFAGDVENVVPASTGGVISSAAFGYDGEGPSLEGPSGLPQGQARTKEDFDRSLSELARALRYVPGSKSVVYFSRRVPGPDVGRLFAEANAAVYAVNTNSVLRSGPARIRKEKEQQGEALQAFSASSGGHYFSDVRDAKKLVADLEDLSGNYYVLGYYVTPSWDGRSHEIAVTVNRRDLEVLAQAGYNDPKPFTSLSGFEKKLQLFDMLLSDRPVGTEALDLPLRVLHGSATEKANAAVLMKLEVDERTGVPPGTTDLYVLIFNADHKIVLAERAELDTGPMDQHTLYPYLLTQLPHGDYECRVAARDKDTGLALNARVPFSVPAASVGQCSLSSPLFLVPSKKAEFARMSRPPKNGGKPESILDFYPFLPVRFVPLLEAFPEDTGQVWVLLPLKSGPGRPGAADLQLKILSLAERRPILVEWSVVDTKRREPDLTFFLIRIDVQGLGPGDYRLDFLAADGSSGSSSSISTTLTKR